MVAKRGYKTTIAVEIPYHKAFFHNIMAGSEIYIRQLASREHLEKETTHNFYRRIFNPDSFVYTSLMNEDPANMFPSLLPLTDIMTIKIALKDSLVGDETNFDEFKRDPCLRALEDFSGIEITPFDFVDFRLDTLSRLLEDWTSGMYHGLGPYCPSESHSRRFLTYVKRAKKGSFKNTRFAYHDMFNE